MQRPTRIVVFGVLCLVIGAAVGVNSLAQAGTSLAGPNVLESMMRMAESMGQEISKTQRENMQVQIRALEKPVYRVGQSIESLASSVMALMLIVGGVGLLAGRSWSLKLTKWWSYYALPAAAIGVVLGMRYIVPEMSSGSTGMAMFQAGLMLLALWSFPVMLLRHLPTDEVKAYLAYRDRQRTAGATAPPKRTANTRDAESHAASPATTDDTTTTPTEPKPAPTTEPAAPAATPLSTTWRDDPWNDPNSK
jgi:hypothetical protein